MYKIYNNKISKFSYVSLNNDYYKLLLRDNIEKVNDNYYKCNEYVYVINCENESDIDYLVSNNFDDYLQSAKLQEEIDNKDREIKLLKDKLSNSDYKLLKNLENYVLGMTLPYEFSSLIYARQEIRDNINNLQDLSEDSELSQAIDRKIKEMCSIAQTTIINGITYNDKKYSLNITDQINLMFGLILANLIPNLSYFPYHSDNNRCEIYSIDDIKDIAVQGILFKTYHTTYYNLLKCEILECSTVDEVNSIYYGIELLNENDRDTLNKIQLLMKDAFGNE